MADAATPAAPDEQWEHYTENPENKGPYGRLKLHVGPTGEWQRYSYDAIGRETKRVEGTRASAGLPAGVLEVTMISTISTVSVSQWRGGNR